MLKRIEIIWLYVLSCKPEIFPHRMCWRPKPKQEAPLCQIVGSLLVWEQPRALWGRTRFSFGIEPRLIRSLFQRGVALLRIVILKSLFLHLKSQVRVWTELYVDMFLRVGPCSNFCQCSQCINSRPIKRRSDLGTRPTLASTFEQNQSKRDY